MSDAGQFGQTCSIASGDVEYTYPMTLGCYVCDQYCGIRVDTTDFGTIWLCTEHYVEYCRGDTDWWELARLIAEAVGG